MRSSVRIAVAACAVGLIVGGCSNFTSGEAQPIAPISTGGESTVPSLSISVTQPSSSQEHSSPIARIDPCELLSDEDRVRLGVGEGEPTSLGTSRACDWQKSGVLTIGVGLKPDLAFKDADLRGAIATLVNIGRHKAYKVEEAGGAKGACEVFVETGESSFAQVTALARTNATAESCDQAVAVAKIIDPKLP